MKLVKGIYLIIDPQQEEEELLHRLKIALESGLSAVQIWDNFSGIDEEQLCKKLADLCQPYNCPLFINNRVELLKLGIFQGLHLDELNAKLIHRVSEKYPKLMIGLTRRESMGKHLAGGKQIRLCILLLHVSIGNSQLM